MYIMNIDGTFREKELKVTPNSNVDALFHEVKTFFFESHKLSHYIEEFDFRGDLIRRYPRPFKAKNIRNVILVNRDTFTGDTLIEGYHDEASLRKCLSSIIEKVKEEEKRDNECITNEIITLIHQNCTSTEDYKQFLNHVQSFFHFSRKSA